MVHSNHILKNGSIVIIRTATIKDAKKLMFFNKKILEETDFHLRMPEEYSVTDYQQEINYISRLNSSPNSIYLIAEQSKKIVGALICEGGRLKRIAHTALIGMAVLKEYWNIGIGTALLSEVINWAINFTNLLKLNLEVFSTNHIAYRLYKKFNFVEEGIRRKEVLINNHYIDLILMAKILR